ncbi:MAG: hypothetical protein Q4G71_13050 [Pseudomonadota bacterium]|nr:hypothetical protein [Pseudomonadota bacterium]
MQDEDLYCKLYVAGASDPDALALMAGEIVRGSVMLGADLVSASALEMSVHAESRHLPLNDEQADFLLWRHYLEVGAANADTSFEAFFAELARFIVALRARGLRVVAACGFEDALNAAV